METRAQNRAQAVAQILLENRGAEDPGFWGWLRPDQPVSMKNANKFLLASLLDYQIPSKTAWDNARRLSEDILGDPPDLWHEVTRIRLEEWNSRRQAYALHRFPKGHERVWTIGGRIVTQYDGDARRIWTDQSTEAALDRLRILKIGEQLSRMVVGALIDTGNLTGLGDVKVDRHIRRVLGRAVQGQAFSLQEEDSVLALTRAMHPDNPWLLDRPLFFLGKQPCKAQNPTCPSCFLQHVCAYHNAL